jgi:glycosyltransferase involved in cell wall biosynthesis
MRVAMIYGEFSSHGHGPYTVDGIYNSIGLTGSEGSFFNLARTLSERGHEVVVFCDTPGEQDHSSGFKMLPIRQLAAFPQVTGVEAVLVWNEPDYLQYVPVGVLKICDQQLNDFPYCRHPDWRTLPDIWVSPSRNHATNVMKAEGVPMERCAIIPNSVDLDLFAGSTQRHPHRAVWCSSPDRGLHHALSLWPEVRRHVPDAELHVFYALGSWLARALDSGDDVGRRARYIENALARLHGHGVIVHDAVPNEQMARELQASACLVYPCDPVKYTEGFGCSVLDAAAAGCVPIISCADALPSVHGDASIGIVGNPADTRDAWVKSIVAVMDGAIDETAQARMRQHADKHSRNAIADQWERLITEAMNARRSTYPQQDCSRPDVSLR